MIAARSRLPDYSSASSELSEVDYDQVYASSVDSEIFDTYYSASGKTEVRSKVSHEFKSLSPKRRSFSSFFHAIPNSGEYQKLLPLMLVLERQQSKSCFEAKITAFYRWKKISLKIQNGIDLSDNLNILRKLADSHLISDTELEQKQNEKLTKSLTNICSALESMHRRNRIKRSNFAYQLFQHWKKTSSTLQQIEKSLPLSLRVFALLDYVCPL
jgi:hypothetical protein